MNLLIITQAVDKNNPYLGFFHHWIEEFSKHYEKATVIALEVGDYNLPTNVTVRSLGKESGVSRFKYLYTFYKYIWLYRTEYDSVFVHMNPVYVVLAGWFWKLSGKKVGLWYTHKQVDLKLRLAERLVDRVFTASAESFQLSSNKVVSFGHGINVSEFICAEPVMLAKDIIRIISVGRIAPIKDLVTLLKAIDIVSKKLPQTVVVDIVGGEVNDDDRRYRQELEILIDKLNIRDKINFIGPVKQTDLPQYYCSADISINLCQTGGMDKAVLESCAAGRPVLVANETFREYFGPDLSKLLIFNHGDHHELATKLINLIESKDQSEIGQKLVELAKTKSGVELLITRLVQDLS